LYTVGSTLGSGSWDSRSTKKFEECVDVEKEEFGSGGENGGLNRLFE
jgi:hypothetical protein